MTDDEVGAKLFGVPIKAKGVNGIGMAILAVAVGGCMFLLYDRGRQSDLHLDAISQAHAIARDRQTDKLSSEHSAIVDALKSLNDGLMEQNFIILSDEKEKQEIKKKYRMPESLKKKLDR